MKGSDYRFRILALRGAPEIEKCEEREGMYAIGLAKNFPCFVAFLQVIPVREVGQGDHRHRAALDQGLGCKAAGAPDLVITAEKAFPAGRELLQLPGPIADP